MISPIWAIEGSWALGVSGHILWPPVCKTVIGFGIVSHGLIVLINKLWVFGDVSWHEPVISWSVAWEVNSSTVWHKCIVSTCLASSWEGLWIVVATKVILIEIIVENTWYIMLFGVVINIWIVLELNVVAGASVW